MLPAAFPNLLANGSSGIAVGMATNIPPHNVDELCAALLHLIKHPNATIEKLVEFVPGPDFPTGGVIVEPREQILEAYRTGRGGFRLRAKWHKEETGRGGYQIVVTEIPYQVQKAKLVEQHRRADARRRSCRCSATCATKAPRTSASCWSRKSRTVDPIAADGEPVPADRARDPLRPQHERAVGAARSRTCWSLRDVLQAVARAPQRRAGPALEVPPGQDRAPPRSARRLPDRLPQHRRGDPHRPLRGRAEGQADRARSSSPTCRPRRS